MSLVAQRLRHVHAARAAGDKHALRSAVGALHLALRAEPVDDPLLAGSCLGEVQDDELRAELSEVAAQLAPRIARANALVVDGAGVGRVITVIVALVPGRTGVWTPMPVERDADVAAQLAAAVVLGPDAPRWSVRWQVDDPTVALHGTSIGLAMAVATAAALAQRQVDPGWAFTGGVDLDGAVAQVSGLPAKLRAASQAGLRAVVVPSGPARGPDGLEVVPAARVEAVLLRLGLRTDEAAPLQRRRAVALLGLLVAPALSFVGLVEPLDGLAYDLLGAAVVEPIASDHTAVLLLPEASDVRALREQYPAVIDRLVEVGASAVAFDLTFTAPAPADAAFADAVLRAERAGMPVVVAARMVDGRWDGPGSEALASAVRPAIVTTEHDLLTGRVRRLPVRDRGHEVGGWHLAVQALRAHLGSGEPQVVGGELVVGITRNPVEVERVWLPAVRRPLRLDWAAPEGWTTAHERVVFIGVGGGARDWFRSPSGALYGVELHATAMEALARQAALRRSSPAAQALGALGFGLATFTLRLRVPRRLRWVALVPGVVGALVAVAATAIGYLAGVAGLLLAVGLGSAAGSRWREQG